VFRGKTLTVPFDSTQSGYNVAGNPANMNYHVIQGGVEILLVTSCYIKARDKMGHFPRMQTLPHLPLIFPFCTGTYVSKEREW